MGFVSKLRNLFKIKRHSNGYAVSLNHAILQQQIDRAQVALDTQVWLDLQGYMPFGEGDLVRETGELNAIACGSGRVYLYPPDSEYGHYQYEGELYVDPYTGKGAFYSPEYGFWSRPGVEKVPSGRQLVYTNPQAEAHWGEACKRDHITEWDDLVKRALK